MAVIVHVLIHEATHHYCANIFKFLSVKVHFKCGYNACLRLCHFNCSPCHCTTAGLILETKPCSLCIMAVVLRDYKVRPESDSEVLIL